MQKFDEKLDYIRLKIIVLLILGKREKWKNRRIDGDSLSRLSIEKLNRSESPLEPSTR